MILQWKFLQQKVGSKAVNKGLGMIFQMSMYYLSFTPLWIAVVLMDFFSVINKEQHLCTEYISIPLIIVVFAFCVRVVKKGLNPHKRDNLHEYRIKEAKEDKLLAAEFLMAFVLPLFAFDFTKCQGVILFLVFFLIFGWLCIRHNYFCVNIVVEIMGYRIYDCDFLTLDEVLVKKKILSKRQLKECAGMTIRIKSLNNDYVLDCCLPSASETEDE